MESEFNSVVVPVYAEYNPDVDLQEVEQFGFINLCECYTNGVIPGALDFTDESFNGVQNPGTLISRSQDVFDGIRKAEYVRSCLDKMNSEEREKAEKAIEKSMESSASVSGVTS